MADICYWDCFGGGMHSTAIRVMLVSLCNFEFASMHQSSCCSWAVALNNRLNIFFLAEYFTPKAKVRRPGSDLDRARCVRPAHIPRGMMTPGPSVCQSVCLASLLRQPRVNLVNQISSILVVWIWLQPSLDIKCYNFIILIPLEIFPWVRANMRFVRSQCPWPLTFGMAPKF